MSGADSLVTLDKTKRREMPERRTINIKGGRVKREPTKKFNKRKNLYTKRNKIILLVLKEMANNAKHYLSRDLERFDCGIEAFDFLIKKMDPMSVDPTNENANSFEKFQKLELTSISQGSFSKFFSLFEHYITEMTETKGISFTDEYSKSLLLAKLSHISYATMKLPSATRSPYDEFVKELYQFAVIIEKDQPYKKALMNNATSSKNNDNLKEIDYICGFKIDERGNCNKIDFKGMTDEKRETFLTKRREFIKDDKVKFKKHSKFEPNKIDEDNKGGNKYNKMQSTLQGKINNLTKELDDNKSKQDKPKSEKASIINNVKSMDIPEAQRNKIVAYMEKHVKALRTVHFNSSLVKKANLLETFDDKAPTIIDGGADTGMNGSSYIFLEHTLRKANVIGYDSDMIKKGLPIGTSVTATKDIHGDTVILLQNEQIDHTSQPNSMLAPNQVRHFGIDLDDCPSCYEIDDRIGRQSMKSGEHEIPFTFEKGLIYLHTWRPSEHELNTCPVIMITSDTEWNPDSMENQPPVKSPWDPLTSSDDRHIIDSNVRNIIANRFSQGTDIHIMHTSTNSKPQDDPEDDISDCYIENLDDLKSIDKADSISSSSTTSTDITDLPDLVYPSHSVSSSEDDSSSSSSSNSSISDYSEADTDLDDEVSIHSRGDSEKYISFAGNAMTRHIIQNTKPEELQSENQTNNLLINNLNKLTSSNEPNKYINARKSKKLIERDWTTLRRRLGWLPIEIIKKTFEVTTQLAKVDIRLPLRRHFKSRFPQANVNRLKETFSTDTFFSSDKAIGGQKCVQLFVGNKSTLVVPYGMTTESEGPTKLQDFIRDWGAPSEIFRDNSADTIPQCVQL